MIQEQHDQGIYLTDIAHQLGVHPKTVRRALNRGGPPHRGRQREKYRKLKPYLAKIDELVASGVWNAAVIYRELQALGYRGKERIVRQYLQPKRVLRPSKATVRFETAPGQQLQHDWGELSVAVGGVEQTIYIAVNTLGYSRRFHVFAAPRCDADHTYESLVQAFGWFGGVPAQVWVDNQKAAVLQHTPGAVQFNERFRQLASHYGFIPKACRPYRARTKGKVERMVGYVKQHFFVRYRQFESLAHLNQQLQQWLLEDADQRYHGTVKEVVAQRFAREQPLLKPVPSLPFDTSYSELRHVGWDGYINVRGNRYSVPAALCGLSVTVQIQLDGRLRVLHGQRCVAEHTLRPAEVGWQSVAEHHQPLWQAVAVERRALQCYQELLDAPG